MGLSRRMFSKEFKLAVVQRLERGSSIGEVARALEVNPNVLHRWRREIRQGPGNVFPGQDKQRLAEGRVAELERKIGQQALEIDFLKGCLQRIEEQRMLQALTGSLCQTRGQAQSDVKLQVMSPLFAKLNYKDHKQIVVLDSPDSFESELAALKGVEIIRDLKKANEVMFSLAFVTTLEQIDAVAPAIARKALGDAIVWFAYPKRTSKKYKSQIDRDNGWNILGHEGFEPVRMVAIDEDWSALRFRRSEFIKNMTRPKDYRLTERAKARPAKTPAS